MCNTNFASVAQKCPKVQLKYELTENWTLIGSAGRSFLDDQSGSPVLMTFFGLQWTADAGR